MSIRQTSSYCITMIFLQIHKQDRFSKESRQSLPSYCPSPDEAASEHSFTFFRTPAVITTLKISVMKFVVISTQLHHFTKLTDDPQSLSSRLGSIFLCKSMSSSLSWRVRFPSLIKSRKVSRNESLTTGAS